MVFVPNTTPTLTKQPRYWAASIGNGDASAWKFLYDENAGFAGLNGSQVVAVKAASTDGTARVVQLAKCRVFTGVTVTIATPGVVSWSLANGNTAAIGDQIVWLNNGDTLPTGLAFNTTYFIIAGGFTVNTSFELATSAGGTAINTTGSQSGTHQAAIIRPTSAQTVAITAGTDGATVSADLLGLDGGYPVNNDGQKYMFLEGTNVLANVQDALAVSAVTTVTANKMISVHAYGSDF